MHLKRLKSMCIDEIVNATVRYQLYRDDLKEVFYGVRELWKELFGLQHVHMEAVSLLHDRVLHTKQGSGITTPGHNELLSWWKNNTFPCIVTLLAAGTKELLYNTGGLFSDGVSLDCIRSEIFTETNNLTTLKVCHGMCQDDFLVQLLPRCHKLTSLSLDDFFMCTVLQAARRCPLQTLTINIDTLFHSVEGLAKVILGIPFNSVKSTLDTYMEGQQVSLSPTWPSLNSLTLKGSEIPFHFLTLVLVAHPNLEQLYTDAKDQTDIIKDYTKILTKLPLLHELSLTSVTVITYNKLLEIQQACPKLQHVKCTIYNKESLVGLLQLACHQPNLIHLELTLLSGITFPFQLIMGRKFEGSNQITTLEVEAITGFIDARWIMVLLKLFPCLKRLNLSSKAIWCREGVSNRVGTFPNLTNLQYIYNDTSLSMSFLSRFPNLYELTIRFRAPNMFFSFKRLTELKNLRVLHLYEYRKYPLHNILDLCQVPRETPDGSPWILYVAQEHVPERVIGKLQRAGWTWRPIAPDF